MRDSRKAPVLVLAAIAAVLAAALAVAGCGGSSSGGGGEPASLASKDALVYIEANLAPEAKASEEINELTEKVFGIDNVGEFIATELEKLGVENHEKFDFGEDIEPWVGEKAGLFLKELHGDNFTGGGFAIETSNSGEAEEFLEKLAEEAPGGEKPEEGEFEGDRYWVQPHSESVIGVIGDYLAYGEDKAYFEEMVENAENDEGLSESEKFKTAMEAAPEEGIGRVYVDLGGSIQSVDAETEAFFSLLQIQPQKATLVGTIIPGSDQVELDVTTDVGKGTVQSGDASKLLESLPATAVLGFATPEFGKSLGTGIHGFSETGIPGQMEPGELEAALEQIGINLESLGENLGDAGGFVEGGGVGDVGGAMVIETTNGGEARRLIAGIGLVLQATGTEGVTATNGKITGFSVHSKKLGRKPLIVGSAGEKIVIAYGPKAAARALRSSGATLGTTPDFEAAKGALGSTPISLFIDGGPGLKLLEGVLSPEEREEIASARPYLQKIAYAAVGSEAKGRTTTAKVIVGLSR
ncbi:MAG TPA: DUF3352 domain-containing protein [Solirubrobacterales bacterium]|nr:DUF3352 domain-containing protein [Solirubrobacterales bacterium]